MSLYNLMHSAVFRLKDIRDGYGTYGRLARLRKEQYLPPNELQEIREQRLHQLLHHARTHSPYYRQLLKDVDLNAPAFALSSLPAIPLLTRDKLCDNLEQILCDNAVDCLPDSSGGSTGAPVNFYHDPGYGHQARATGLLFLGWMGIRPGDKTAVFWGADRDIGEALWRERLLQRFNRTRLLNSFSMTEQLVASFIGVMNKFKPKYVYGYASSLHFVAEFINKHQPLKFQPMAVRSSAEKLHDFQREEIERAFGTRVFDFYGSREVNHIAAECPTHEGMHIFASGRIVEIVDEEGRPLPSGEVGNIAVTDLTNLGFPFIRYLNGDMAAMSTTVCSCGRTYPMLEKIVGRSSDLITVNGKTIHGEYFTHLFYGHPEVTQFQLIQETADRLKLLVITRAGNADLEYFRRSILEKTGPGVNVEVIRTSCIEPTPAGKHRFTISHLHGGQQN